MFDDKEVVEYFKSNYSSITDNKDFTGFKIEINPTKTEFEQNIIPDDSGYKFIRVSINKEEVKNRNVNTNTNTSDTTSTSSNESKTDSTSKDGKDINNPDTGSFISTISIIGAIGLVTAIGIAIKKKNRVYKI